jgi:hypothetical protein
MISNDRKDFEIIFSEWYNKWFNWRKFSVVTNLPQIKWISSSIFRWFLRRLGNSFFNASSRSQVASFSPCLLQWTLQIHASKFLVLLVMVSKILMGTSWYYRSFCKSIVSTGTCWARVPSNIFLAKRHETPGVCPIFPLVALYGMLPLQLYLVLRTVRCIEGLIYLDLETLEYLKWVRPWDKRNLLW